jgi:hypothetical protein
VRPCHFAENGAVALDVSMRPEKIISRSDHIVYAAASRRQGQYRTRFEKSGNVPYQIARKVGKVCRAHEKTQQ